MGNTFPCKLVHQAVVQVSGDRHTALAGRENDSLHIGSCECFGKLIFIDQFASISMLVFKKEVPLVMMVQWVALKYTVAA